MGWPSGLALHRLDLIVEQMQVALPHESPNRPCRVVGLDQLLHVHGAEHQLVAPDRFHPNPRLILSRGYFCS
jgi:hypothetical protein